MLRIPFTGALVATVAFPLTAQHRIVSPEAMTNAASSRSTSLPWGPARSPETFVHTIYDDLLGRPRVLRGMAFRPQAGIQTYVPKSYVVRVTLADAMTGSSNISLTFSNNFRPMGASTVVFHGVLNWPAFPYHFRAPAPFAAVIAFTTPHAYTGVDPLLQEIYISNVSLLTPAHYFESSPSGTHTAGPVGAGCTATGRSAPMDATGHASSSAVRNYLANGPAGAPAVLLFGDTSNTFGGLPLPFDLAILGSPGCFLNINPVAVLGASTTATGTATHSLTYLQAPSNSGKRLRTQWVVADGGVLRTSNGLDHGTPFAASATFVPMNHVYVDAFGATPPATARSLGFGGPITEWHE